MLKMMRLLPKAVLFALFGAAGGVLGWLGCEMIQAGESQTSSGLLTTMLQTSMAFAPIGAFVALALVLCSELYLRERVAPSRWPGLLASTAVGALGGFVSGGLAQFMFAVGGQSELLRIACWGLAGALVGLVLSIRVPNLRALRGLGGGFVGGAVGGLLFIMAAMMTDVLGRLVGFACIGFFIGLMVMLIEEALTQVWLEVGYGPREVRTVSLGAEAITVGGDASICTVYASGAAPQALRYQVRDGQVMVDDLVTGQAATARVNDQRTAGRVTLTVRVRREPVASAKAHTQTMDTPSGLPTTVASRSLPATSVAAQGPLQLHLSNGRAYSLAQGAELWITDLPGLRQGERAVVAEVTTNPNDVNVLGLRNCSLTPWDAVLPNGDQRKVEPGKSVRVAAGTRLTLGSLAARIDV